MPRWASFHLSLSPSLSLSFSSHLSLSLSLFLSLSSLPLSLSTRVSLPPSLPSSAQPPSSTTCSSVHLMALAQGCARQLVGYRPILSLISSLSLSLSLSLYYTLTHSQTNTLSLSLSFLSLFSLSLSLHQGTANVEVLHIVAQFVLDWRLEVDKKAYAKGDASASSGGGTTPRLADRVAPTSVDGETIGRALFFSSPLFSSGSFALSTAPPLTMTDNQQQQQPTNNNNKQQTTNNKQQRHGTATTMATATPLQR